MLAQREFSLAAARDILLPEQFRELFCGGFSLSLEALPEHERGRFGGEQTFPDPNDPYDVVWHQKLGVIPVMNGDYLGIDLRAGHQGEIVYLSHDDSSRARGRLDRFPEAVDTARLPRSRGLAMDALTSKGTILDPDGICAGMAGDFRSGWVDVQRPWPPMMPQYAQARTLSMGSIGSNPDLVLAITLDRALTGLTLWNGC